MTKKLKRTLALAALMTGVGGLGVANATEGWYGRADVGMSIDGQLDGEVADGNTTASFGPDLEDGWLGDVGVGYGFDNGFRIDRVFYNLDGTEADMHMLIHRFCAWRGCAWQAHGREEIRPRGRSSV